MKQNTAGDSFAASPDHPAASANPPSVAEAYLNLLKARGIDFLYLGAGSDTAPRVEAYARREPANQICPQPVIVSHENLSVGMAH